MFFTDNSWKAVPRFTGVLREPYDRWRMVGLSRATPTFVVRHTGVESDDIDSYVLLVAGTELLVSLLAERWPEVPKVFALAHDRMTPIDEIWSYHARGRKHIRYFAWRAPQGDLVPCEANQPAPAEAVNRVCLWKEQRDGEVLRDDH
ncbi:hypothetical protein SBC1_74780 (plasmid) [Caballeronia sp. SBC1]|uniref:hypothetical protein n=1 Tax=unclassified Caballeronia TaxID=2646786 RepID=UPI0013E105ED|nr:MULTISPECIES: hypothetical protein [unclassified Caballeronia]QIE29075.1 hypothetical protein SBC2_71510 [Caballeronia sp. SBC2]QIN67431.1 hypothetical protein SBC1_74780 [Caballeronia sp. SBC1]